MSIAKFYFHDAATSNTGTMPSGAIQTGGGTATTGDATGARTARTANGTIGASQTSSLVTSTANINAQSWGHRRFVSSPLAAQTLPWNVGGWVFSYARTESNLLHNQIIQTEIYAWRPGTGAQVGTNINDARHTGTEPTVAAAQQAESLTSGGGGTDLAIDEGDILVFDIATSFTQGMATSYTENFFYDGTTEASITTCATFVTPPFPLLVQGERRHTKPAVVAQSVKRASCWMKSRSGIVVPRLWTPADSVGV